MQPRNKQKLVALIPSCLRRPANADDVTSSDSSELQQL